MQSTIKKVATRDSDSATVTGDYGSATVTGEYSRASASGYYGRATAIDDYSSATVTGDCSRATAIGDYSRATAIGCRGVAIAGHNGAAKADKNGCVAVIYFDEESNRPRIAVGYVGENGIKADTWYCVENGTLKEEVE